MHQEPDDHQTGPSSEDQGENLFHLPNGIVIHHKNEHETKFLYQEIFVEKIYFKYGISLQKGACVFDVGANIGMFTLFVKETCPDATVYAFEPTPDLHRIIKRNVQRFGQSVKTYQCGVSDHEGEAIFTYYPNYSIISGFHADARGDANILSSGIHNQLAARRKNVPDDFIERLAQEKLSNKIEIKCPLKTISSIIREAVVEKIDLLKIDAEKSELSILKGIQAHDWAKIGQIVLEVHSEEELKIISSLLNQQGFKIEVEQEGQFAASSIFNCFARRA